MDEGLKGGNAAVASTTVENGNMETTTKLSNNGNTIILPPSGRWNLASSSTEATPTGATATTDDNKVHTISNDEGKEEVASTHSNSSGSDLFPALEKSNPNDDTTPEQMQIVPFDDAKPCPAAADSAAAAESKEEETNDHLKEVKITNIKRKRATGLGNLGNTCFMNSTLQCLAHTAPLREYFLTGRYEGDINTDNPLGTGGELAREFAGLLSEMWQTKKKGTSSNGGNATGIYSSSRVYSPGNYDSGLSSVTYPRCFKHTLGKHASQFVGYDQHDSQELAIYLLDALHEDTNRIRKKPYIEKAEQAEDESDDMAAAKAWGVHLQREDSRILESCMGQVKSRLQCPVEGCGRVSTTFDPSMYLSVPIPGSTDRVMKVTFVPLPFLNQQQQSISCAAELMLTVCKNSTVGTLRKLVVELARECYGMDEKDLLEEDVQFADIFQQKVWTYYGEDVAIDGIKDTDMTYAYQLRPLVKVREEFATYQEKKQNEKEKNKPDSPKVASGATSASTLDAATKEELDKDRNWENKLSSFLAQPPSLYRILNERRSTHEERVGFYRKLLVFILKCKKCSDATAENGDADGDVVMATNGNNSAEENGASQSAASTSTPTSGRKKKDSDDSLLTLEEVTFASSQFRGVHNPKDLAILEYCASKFMTHTSELKNSATKKNNDMNEDGIVVQIKIKKSEPFSMHYGSSTNKSSTKYSWKVVGDPIIARIPSSLTVGGLREMLGKRISCALKLNDDHHNRIAEDNSDNNMIPSQSPETTIMRQVALSYENGSRTSNNRYNHGSDDTKALGSVKEDSLTEIGACRVFAKPNDKEENELVSSIVDDEGAITLSWPSQLNDIFDEDLLNAKDEYLTEQQKKEREASSSSPGNENKVSVMDCIAKYCEMEQLDESDMWYCSKCKDHVRAWKQFHLYRTPPILIIHLKRFHFSSTTHRRDKIDTLIDFPLTDLDLQEYVSHSEPGQEPIYDCYAVSNHFGGTGGGHYTAYAKADDGSWCNFDDSRVTTGVDESEVVSSAAYCLYYKRRDIVFNMDAEDDASMTKDDSGGDCSDQGSMMPVSPCPHVEVGGESPENLKNDTMEVDNQDDDVSTGASYATPVASLNGNEDDMDGDSTSAIRPDSEKEADVFFDLQ